MSENKYKSWMITILSDKTQVNGARLPSSDVVTKAFQELSEKWVYQLENHENAAEENLQHFQAAVVTKIRLRQSTLLIQLSTLLGHKKERIYVQKMAGTWDQAYIYCTKQDSQASKPVVCPAIQNQYGGEDVSFLSDPSKRYKWQNQLIDILFEDVSASKIRVPNNRELHWVQDSQGGTGKSNLVKWLAFNHIDNISKLAFGRAGQIRSAIVSLGARQIYFVDMPRTLGDDDSLISIISSLEDCKNGHVTSAFYGTSNTLFMYPPHIVVMSNQACPRAMMSDDRWRSYKIVGRELMIEVEHGQLSKLNA